MDLIDALLLLVTIHKMVVLQMKNLKVTCG